MESDVESYFRRKVKSLNGRAYKFISPGNAGVPDRIVIVPDAQTGQARISFVELKRPGGELRPQQRVKFQELERLGVKCTVVDSREAADRFLRELLGEV